MGAEEGGWTPDDFTVTLEVVDDSGDPLGGAVFETRSGRHIADRDGRIVLSTNQPVAGVVTADDHLAEPVVASRDASHLAVRLFRREGDEGLRRIAMHFGGDVMLGRRYLEPTRDGTALLRSGSIDADARAVVGDLAPLFAAADVSMVNLETVVGDLPQAIAYPHKRFLLQTPPEALGALDEMGVDVVALGNNHVNDWQALGVASTVAHVEAAGLAHTGAGADAAQAVVPVLVDADRKRIGVLSYTTVNGNFVNDNLPLSDEQRPAAVPTADAWLWEAKEFAWSTPDGHVLIGGRLLPGDAWQAWRDTAPKLSARQQRALWAALSDVFPELQDWVARRGHGGAAWFRTDTIEADIAGLRDRGADLVVVQLHGGFQFSETGSGWLQHVARRSIDAGADVVIGHHPHVLQGFEWHRGKLIAYSLGNLVFDQDFLATYDSVMVRLVYEGVRLIEAKLVPVSLENYRPVPAADATASSILRTIDARSAVPATALRQDDGSVANVLGDTAGRSPVRLTMVGNAGYLGHPTTSISALTVDVPAVGSARIDTTRLVRPTTNLEDIWVGRDILRRGSFDDHFADGVVAGGSTWTWRDSGRLIPHGSGHALELSTRPGNTSDVLARPVARVTRRDVGFFDAEGHPIADQTFYTVRLQMRRTTDVDPEVRLVVYHFDDHDPVRDPVNDVVREVVVPVDVPSDGKWHEAEVKLPAETFAPDGDRAANAAFLYLQVPPGRGVVGFDDVQLLEFRPAWEMPPELLQEVDAVRSSAGAQTIVLSLD